MSLAGTSSWRKASRKQESCPLERKKAYFLVSIHIIVKLPASTFPPSRKPQLSEHESLEVQTTSPRQGHRRDVRLAWLMNRKCFLTMSPTGPGIWEKPSSRVKGPHRYLPVLSLAP